MSASTERASLAAPFATQASTMVATVASDGVTLRLSISFHVAQASSTARACPYALMTVPYACSDGTTPEPRKVESAAVRRFTSRRRMHASSSVFTST